MTRVNPWLACLVPLLLTAGCAVGPDYSRPALQAPVPQAWTGSAVPATAAGDSARPARLAVAGEAGAAGRWWESFGDTTLNRLVDQALAHNPQLDQAAARVLEARAGVTGAASPRWPTLEIGGQLSRAKSSEDVLLFGPLYSSSSSASVTARWELDLWGRLARGEQAARAALLAGEHNRRAVLQGLIADVVRGWLTAGELELQVALTERTIASYQDSYRMVEERYRRGLVGPLDLHLAGQNLSAAQAQLPAFRQQLAVARRGLEVLAGRYPTGLPLTGVTGDGPPLPAPLAPVPAGLPSELLDRRPDLLAAEASLAAAVARIGQAKGALFPRLSLTADGGTRSRDIADLFAQGTDAWSLVGNLVMPLLNRGATRSQVEVAEARAREAVAAYRGAVLRAFAEVENALDQDLNQQERERHLAASAASARSAVQLAEERYQRGLDGLLTTLESQRRLFTVESSLLAAQRERRVARVELIRALGGSWDADAAIAHHEAATKPEGERP
ncbi:MAG: efflux transporter outer membrane subunit [bacterium]|nr:efflux transporter outer membrane subunit [bacterium]